MPQRFRSDTCLVPFCELPPHGGGRVQRHAVCPFVLELYSEKVRADDAGQSRVPALSTRIQFVLVLRFVLRGRDRRKPRALRMYGKRSELWQGRQQTLRDQSETRRVLLRSRLPGVPCLRAVALSVVVASAVYQNVRVGGSGSEQPPVCAVCARGAITARLLTSAFAVELWDASPCF